MTSRFVYKLVPKEEWYSQLRLKEGYFMGMPDDTPEFIRLCTTEKQLLSLSKTPLYAKEKNLYKITLDTEKLTHGLLVKAKDEYHLFGYIPLDAVVSVDSFRIL